MKGLLPIFITALLYYGCETQDCKELPETFQSYLEAEKEIERSSFKIKEQLDTSRSSWISDAKYYSCNGEYGYLSISTEDNNIYIHTNVPIGIWSGFKKAESFGRYYNRNLKNNYGIKLYK